MKKLIITAVIVFCATLLPFLMYSLGTSVGAAKSPQTSKVTQPVLVTQPTPVTKVVEDAKVVEVIQPDKPLTIVNNVTQEAPYIPINIQLPQPETKEETNKVNPEELFIDIVNNQKSGQGNLTKTLKELDYRFINIDYDIIKTDSTVNPLVGIVKIHCDTDDYRLDYKRVMLFYIPVYYSWIDDNWKFIKMGTPTNEGQPASPL